MAQLEERPSAPLSDTVSFFRSPIEFTIDWTIRDFVSMKARKTVVHSNRTIVGTSAWRVELYPLYQEDKDQNEALFDAAAAFLHHDHLGSNPRDMEAFFKITVYDKINR